MSSLGAFSFLLVLVCTVVFSKCNTDDTCLNLITLWGISRLHGYYPHYNVENCVVKCKEYWSLWADTCRPIVDDPNDITRTATNSNLWHSRPSSTILLLKQRNTAVSISLLSSHKNLLYNQFLIWSRKSFHSTCCDLVRCNFYWHIDRSVFCWF